MQALKLKCQLQQKDIRKYMKKHCDLEIRSRLLNVAWTGKVNKYYHHAKFVINMSVHLSLVKGNTC